ncbi:hypothetical protein niasHS_010190 [Heterodera schachtii]|uniref:DnaJ homolog subfamily C member 21 n=1 Tax=Heterodera schachtii TaxID=97005 RepID=A0ABD2J4K6_HETSC
MASALILAGLGIAAAGFTGRYIIRNKHLVKQAMTLLPTYSIYERGGFAAKMTRHEAAKILGVSMNARTERIREAHKRVMVANHPDRGGSPYMAAKINEAKDLMER